MTAEETPNRGTFLWLALGVMAFTIYGSLVPFRFHGRGLSEAVEAFEWVLQHRVGIQSRSDFAANFLLGVPLGFCLLAAIRLDRAGLSRDLLAALVLWPWCIVFAMAVEFAQLFFYERTCSGSDILAQSLGSLTGMLLWLLLGERLVRRFRRVWQGSSIGGTAGRLFVVYLAALALVLWLPLDLTLSPAELYHKNFDEATRLVLVPFQEVSRPGGPPLAVKLTAWIELAGLYFPAGLLAGCVRKSARSPGAVALTGLGLAFLLEAGQMFVKSRTTSATDLIVSDAGFLAGWGVMQILKPAPGRGLTLETGLLLGQAWVFVLLVLNWLPFNFQSNVMQAQLDQVSWIPFAAAYEKNYLNSLEEAAAKTLLFGPLGAVMAAIGVRRVVRKRHAVACGVAVAALIEAGQLALPSRVAGPTDLIFGGVGAWLGAATALRIRAFAHLPPKAGTANPVRFRVT